MRARSRPGTSCTYCNQLYDNLLLLSSLQTSLLSSKHSKHWVKQLGTEEVRYLESRHRERNKAEGKRLKELRRLLCVLGASAVLGQQWASRQSKKQGKSHLRYNGAKVQLPPPPSMTKPISHHASFLSTLLTMCFNQGNSSAL